MKKIIGTIALLLMFPTFVLAECSTSDMDRLKKLANNTSYVIEESTNLFDETSVDITLTGMSNNFIYSYSQTPDVYELDDTYQGEVIFKGVRPGATIKVKIFGKDICQYELIRTMTISTASYNEFYNDPICDNAKKYRLCQKWAKVDLNYDEFVKSVQEYIKSNNNSISQNVNEKGYDFYRYYRILYWPVLGTLIIVLIVLIYMWIKQNKKNQL